MNEIKRKPLSFQEQTVLGLMQRYHGDTVTNLDRLDAKALHIVTVSSVIITIISGLQLATAQSGIGDRLWTIFVLYLVTFIAAIFRFSQEAIPVNQLSQNGTVLKRR